MDTKRVPCQPQAITFSVGPHLSRQGCWVPLWLAHRGPRISEGLGPGGRKKRQVSAWFLTWEDGQESSL